VRTGSQVAPSVRYVVLLGGDVTTGCASGMSRRLVLCSGNRLIAVATYRLGHLAMGVRAMSRRLVLCSGNRLIAVATYRLGHLAMRLLTGLS
jgi:hypothetical protein